METNDTVASDSTSTVIVRFIWVRVEQSEHNHIKPEDSMAKSRLSIVRVTEPQFADTVHSNSVVKTFVEGARE